MPFRNEIQRILVYYQSILPKKKKLVLAGLLLLASITLLLLSTVSDEIQKRGIATITFDVPQLKLQSGVELLDIPKEITLGSDLICYRDPGKPVQKCSSIPSDISAWFPSSLDKHLDLSDITPAFSMAVKVNIRAPLMASLVGHFVLATSFMTLLRSGGRTQIFHTWSFSIYRVAIEVMAGTLVFVSLILAATVTFVIITNLQDITGLEVTCGDLAQHLMVIVVLTSLWSVFFFLLREPFTLAPGGSGPHVV